MAWIAAIAGLASASIGASASKKASKREQEGLQYAADLQNQQYLRTREDYRPYTAYGRGAIAEMGRQLGIAPDDPGGGLDETGGYSFPQSGRASEYDVIQAFQMLGRTASQHEIDYYSNKRGRANELYNDVVRPGIERQRKAQPTGAAQGATGGRYGAFYESPGYQFRKDEAMREVDTRGTARGRKYSGGTLREAARYTSGLASQEYGNYFDRLRSVATGGQTATRDVATAGMTAATNIGQAGIYSGISRASSINNRANQYGQAVGAAAGAVGGAVQDWWRRRGASGDLDDYYNQPGNF